MRRFHVFATALLTLAASAAMADTVQPVTGGGGGISGSGQFTATSNGNGSFTITALSGTPGDPSLLHSGAFNGNDNLLFPSGSPALDSHGFAFTDLLGDTGYTVNLFADSGSSTGYEAYLTDTDNASQSLEVTFNLGTASTMSALAAAGQTALPAGTVEHFSYSFAPLNTATTPEPSSLVLLGSGFASLTALLRRRSR